MYLQRGFGIHTRILEELRLLQDSVERRAHLRYELILAFNSRSVVPLPTFVRVFEEKKATEENGVTVKESKVWSVTISYCFKGPRTGTGFTTLQKFSD